jgi:hypothetical protein
MTSGLPIAILAAAQAAAAPAASAPSAEPTAQAARTAYGPSLPAPRKPVPKPAPEPCPPPNLKEDSREIIVCAPKPQGYRLDPDVMEAKRQARDRSRPKPAETFADKSCASVGPMGCMGSGAINLLGAAITAVTMVSKAAKGENVGKMLITDPQPDEYQLYLEAKRRREAKEAEEAALAKAKAAAQPAAPAAPAE